VAGFEVITEVEPSKETKVILLNGSSPAPLRLATRNHALLQNLIQNRFMQGFPLLRVE